MWPGFVLPRPARRPRTALALVFAVWCLFDVRRATDAIAQQHQQQYDMKYGAAAATAINTEKIYICSMHWNSEAILSESWSSALVQLVGALNSGRGDRDDNNNRNVFVSIRESGSWDGTKDALRTLDELFTVTKVPHRIVLDNTTHRDEMDKTPVAGQGWVTTPRGKIERRRIPYLADLRNAALQPLYEQLEAGVVYDKILFLGDVMFTVASVRALLSTRGGDYAAACSLDFSRPPALYDTFALRDAEGHAPLMLTWPYFRSRASRHAVQRAQPVPVQSCWNGMVVMDAKPFYNKTAPLHFRGLPDSLAEAHLEASECCLVHADNNNNNNGSSSGSSSKGVWLNTNVRVGYTGAAFAGVHPVGVPWVSTRAVVTGLWKNRLLRWFSVTWFKERIVDVRMRSWQAKDAQNKETGLHCIVNEMQVLAANGWAHV